MKNIQKKLETISLDLDAIVNRLHEITREKQNYCYSKSLKSHNSKQKNYSVKTKNTSPLIEYLQDLEHIIKIGKNIVKFILLENIPQSPKATKPQSHKATKPQRY